MSINARVRKLQRTGYVSYQFEILNHFRDKSKLGRPNHKVVARFGTIKEHFSGVPLVQQEFWKKVDTALNKLIKRGEISDSDRAKIEKRFAEFISRPAPALIVPAKPKVTLKSLASKYPLLRR